MSVFMPIIEEVTSWVSNNTSKASLPWPFNHISQGISLAHIGAFVAKADKVSLPKLALNHIISQQALIPELARAILIARRALAVFQQARVVKNIHIYLSTVASGSFPVPVRQLRENITEKQSFFEEILVTTPYDISAFLSSMKQTTKTIEQLFHATMVCLWNCVELLFSLYHDTITRFEANTEIGSNFQEICDELEKDPEKLSREIDANAEALDVILPWIHPDWTTKNLSAAITKGIKTVVDVNNTAKTMLDMFVDTVKQSVFILSSIVTNSKVAPFGVGTVPANYTKGPMDGYYKLAKSKQNQRFFI